MKKPSHYHKRTNVKFPMKTASCLGVTLTTEFWKGKRTLAHQQSFSSMIKIRMSWLSNYFRLIMKKKLVLHFE